MPLAISAATSIPGRGLRHAVTIPWGDAGTVYHSTGIRTSRVYLPAPAALLALGTRFIDPLRPLLGRQRVQDWLKGQVDKRITCTPVPTRRPASACAPGSGARRATPAANAARRAWRRPTCTT
ncbi:hypothetical protein P4123_28715 [Pseudomonas aeruginosa]|nr:hypothetical protein [Pseudomonas aeruginosa]